MGKRTYGDECKAMTIDQVVVYLNENEIQDGYWKKVDKRTVTYKEPKIGKVGGVVSFKSGTRNGRRERAGKGNGSESGAGCTRGDGRVAKMTIEKNEDDITYAEAERAVQLALESWKAYVAAWKAAAAKAAQIAESDKMKKAVKKINDKGESKKDKK